MRAAARLALRCIYIIASNTFKPSGICAGSVNWMNRYRLIVHQHNKLLGHFESDTPWVGYDLELLVSSSEQRLPDSRPDGIRGLSSELKQSLSARLIMVFFKTQ